MSLRDAIGGGSSSDIILTGTLTGEVNNLQQRIDEEIKPDKTDQADPLTCLKYGIPLAVAKIMTPNDFTQEVAKTLISKNVPEEEMMRLYGFKQKPAFNHVIKTLGLFPVSEFRTENKAHPWRTYQEPKDAVKQEISQSYQNMPTKEKPLVPEDLTKEIFIELDKTTSRQQIKRNYNFKNDAYFYKQLHEWDIGNKQMITPEKIITPTQETTGEELNAFEAFEKLNSLTADIKCLKEIDYTPLTEAVKHILADAYNHYKEEYSKLMTALENTKVMIA